MRSLRNLAVGAIFGAAWLIGFESVSLAGEKIEITPVSPSSKSSALPTVSRSPSKLDLELDRLEGARIQMIPSAGPRMSIPAPVQRPADDGKKENWLLDSAGGDKALDYNGALGVRDYSGKARQNPSGNGIDLDGRTILPGGNAALPGRNDFNRGDGSRRDPSGRVADGLLGLNGLPLRTGPGVDPMAGLRESSSLYTLPGLPRNSDRDLELLRNRSALKSEVDGILSGIDSRSRGPLGNPLSVESILRLPGSPNSGSLRPRFEAPSPIPATADPLRAPALPRDLTPSAAFNKQSADAVSAQRPKLSEPERSKDEQRYRPAVLPFPKRGF